MKRSFLTGCVVIILTAFLVSPAYPVSNADYAAQPPFISQAVPPMVLMIMGRDHKLYKPAYNDASDIDSDGILDITYKHSIDYYGYFDPYKCYDYGNLTSGVDGFFPSSVTINKYCDGTKWSGNFLNWVGTSRIDALRRVLYGGYRAVDNTSLTILEAEHINEDAHSWGKEYAGLDISQLTPFSDPSGGALPTCMVDWSTTQQAIPNPLPGGLTCTNQPWLYYQQPQKILEVTYDDAGGYTDGRKYGNTHDDLINSYSLCNFSAYSYIGDFNNSDLVKTTGCATATYGGISYTLSCPITQDHMNTFNRILVTEFDVTTANAGAWDFAIDGVNGVEMQLFDRSVNHRSTTNPWVNVSGGEDDTVVAYYGQHSDSAKWTTSPFGPNTTGPDFGAGSSNYCADTTSTPSACSKMLHTGVQLNAGRYRMVVRMRADTSTNSYDGVKVFYRNPDTRLSAHNGAHWIVFGALADIDGSNITSSSISSGSIPVSFDKNAETITWASSGTVSPKCTSTNNFTNFNSGSGFVVGDSITTTYTNAPGPYTIKTISADGCTITIAQDITVNKTTTNYTVTVTRTTYTPINLTYRAPEVPSGESVRFKDRAFIKDGEPSWQGNPVTDPGDIDAYGHIINCSKHLLFCITSPQADTGGNSPGAPIIRVLTNSTHRIWEWASTERAVCSGPETPSSYKHLIATDGGKSGSAYIGAPAGSAAGDYKAYFDRVKVCDTSVGIESYCKLYPGGGGTYKPAGLFQKYGESQNTVCSKSFKACNTDSDCVSPEACIQNGQMFFGLMTGSYTKNMSGGVIRSNIDSMSHQVDNKNVGQLKSPGGAAGADGFPITNLDRLRMTGFDYTNFQYGCGWIEDRPMNEGECKMWGNPIGEMMYEGLRYFAGRGAPTAVYSSGTGASGTDDATLGLTNQGDPANSWIKPYEKFPLCSKPFMIVLSDVSPSYDSDQLPGVDSNFTASPAFSGDLPGLTSVKDLADTIGTNEGINGTNVFIGQSGSLNDTLCTSKTAGTSGDSTAGLGSLRGLCAEEPTKQGAYYSAAVAYYGKTQFGANNTDSHGNSLPNVTTYGVALISPVPEIKINAGGKTVKIVPTGKSVSGCLNVKTACSNKCTSFGSAATAYNTPNNPNSGLKISGCSSDAFCPTNQVVGFYVDSLNDTYGKFRVSYEDSEQGADHEMDAIVEYTYQVDSLTGEVTISLNSTYAAGCIDQVMGFVISGTDKEDGTYLAVRDLDSNSSGANYTATVYALPTSWSHTFTPSLSGSTTQFLHDPLWYSAKYGGFSDQNNNNIPDTQDEWDQDHKGDPDTYFLISNPLNMEKQLTAVFEDILKKSASGTSVSILATSAEGEGALYQAYFYPEKANAWDNSRKYWLGYVRGLFLDSYGNLREDTNQDSRLVFKDDYVLRMILDPVTNQVTADLYKATAEDGTLDTGPTGTTPTRVANVPVDNIKALWEAGTMLAKRDKSTRNLYVWVDKNKSGTVDQGDFSSTDVPSTTEAMTFTAANAAVLAPYLNTGSTGTATDIINWVRGNTVTGLRDRCLPISGSTTEASCALTTNGPTDRVWALSDVVYSTPTTVAGPKEAYDQIYGDASYLAFRKKYVNRRNVVYLGGNDGMLHAFNAGMYHVGDDPHTSSAIEHGWFVANPSILTGDDFDNGWTMPAPALGDELWGFIPYDNLPHLQWLTDPAYQHVYYVDLRPKTTDVKIFNDSLTGFSGGIDGQANVSHPNGWGTIVIVGQRLGGGAISVTQKFDLVSTTTRTFQSSYYVLDVTNPENPPKLLWRFTDSGLGFSTTYPGIVRIQSGSTVKWFLAIGSGPDNNIPNGTRGYDGSSTQTGKIYIINMMDGTIAKMFDTGDANAFMGDPTVVDGDLDYTADVIYIGSNIAGAPTGGKVYRINTNGDLDPTKWKLSTLINQGQPLLVGPSVTLDQYNNHWVLFGTGRFWSLADKTTQDQQTVYGIRDACWKQNTTTTPCSTTYTLADLKNTSTFAVCTNAAGGAIYDSSTGSCNSGTVAYSSFGDLQTDIAMNYKGWYLNLATGGVPSERVLSKSVVIGGIALVSTFTPNADPCAVQGNSNLYALYFLTGTAYNKPVVGVIGSGSSETVARSTSLGKGLPTTVGVAIGKSTKGFVQTSTGAIVEVNADPAYNVRSGPSSWREKGSGTSGVEQIYRHIVK